MKINLKTLWTRTRRTLLIAALGIAPALSLGALTDLNDIPMAVSNQVTANFMIVLDNSQSMDAYMGGALQSGSDVNTRGNIGRSALKTLLGAYRTSFNWGLSTFDAPDPALRYTYVYYMGNDSSMVFTDDCVSGISVSNGNRPCVANTQPFTGGNYVTYDLSSDDPSILDALYYPLNVTSIWAKSPPGSQNGETDYKAWRYHTTGLTSWADSEFTSYLGLWQFTPTDAGFLPEYPDVTRQMYAPRGWGYISDVTGGGKIVETVQVDGTTHYNNLIAKLGTETADEGSAEIKNAALYTTLSGTLASVKNYFSGQTDWKSGAANTSPITASCQKNFALLVTDGLPTGNASGGLYTEAERTDTCSEWTGSVCTGTWTYGTASTDAMTAVTNLRTVPYTGCVNCSAFDVETYVLALGDTVANARAVAVMNEMASLGGTGTALFANDAATMDSAISSAINNAVSKTGAAAAVAVANANITTTTAAYQSSYNSGIWTGDLQSYHLDISTGVPLTDSPIWSPSAQGQLDVLAPTSRKIVTYTGTAGTNQGIQFQPTTAATATKLSAAQQTAISATDGAGVVDFIRGVRAGEMTTYRQRAHILGDIVDAEPVVVSAPSSNFNDTIDFGYSAFKTARASRASMVYQGANDGMMHVFNAASGAEEWAYIPTFVFSNLANLSSQNAFTHKYYVDSTPTVADVDFIATGGSASSAASNDWHTMLVGGLGKGGYGYYALDITETSPALESAAIGKVLWEFPNSATAGQVVANMGYSYGKPIITKIATHGWVVLVTSGYNNARTVTVGGTSYTGDGKGHLFVLNAKTGALISDITTGIGDTATPSGLSSISGYSDSADVNNYTIHVYGGDLLGNVWRFNMSDLTVVKLATLVDASSNVQPITTAPEIASIFEGNKSYRFIYVGTGKYLADTDVSTSGTQSMYGLIDDLTTTPTISPLRSNLQQQTLTLQGDNIHRTASSNTFVLTTGQKKLGWYIDLPQSRERISTDPQLAFGAIVFTSNVPSDVSCIPGGSSWFNILDYRTGGSLVSSSLPFASISLGDALASRPVLIRLPSGELRALIRKSDDDTVTQDVPVPPSSPNVRRVSWRELPDTQK